MLSIQWSVHQAASLQSLVHITFLVRPRVDLSFNISSVRMLTVEATRVVISSYLTHARKDTKAKISSI